VTDALPWWRRAVLYEVYLRSFADGDGDGLGDLAGLRSRLPYIERLGVDAVWVTPFYPTPDFDHGYDVADYCAVDPRFGTLDAFDELVADAHVRGLRLLVDLVPNHTSSQHPWFLDALRDRRHPDRCRYIWAPGRRGGPPNNWTSVFGGPAWTRDERSGEWYLHLFSSDQPDLDWRNPEVAASFDQVLRFWLDRGVDGFRIDVAHGLVKDADLRDNPPRVGHEDDSSEFLRFEQRHTFDQEGVHDVYRRWRGRIDAYPGDRVLLGEVFLLNPDPARVARYLRPDELHLAFNFHLLAQPWDAARFRASIEATLRELERVPAIATWVLSNHDVIRHATRYGGGTAGDARSRAAVLLVLALPGAACLYQGEELGLEEVDVPAEARQDPVYRLTGRLGRAGCRVPLPWTTGGEPGYGFTAGTPWLPTPRRWGSRSVEAQERDPASTLHLYRKALALRHALGAFGDQAFRWLPAPDGCLAFARGRRASLACAVNMGAGEEHLPVGGQLVLASESGVRLDSDRLTLPPSTAAWVATGG
jgi:alpha-glucosidase